jgi:hypothetical protein
MEIVLLLSTREHHIGFKMLDLGLLPSTKPMRAIENHPIILGVYRKKGDEK